MNRRDFVISTGASVAAIGVAGQTTASAADGASVQRTPLPIKMYVGCQRGPTTPKLLDHFKRHGVTHICGYPEISSSNGCDRSIAQLRPRFRRESAKPSSAPATCG